MSNLRTVALVVTMLSASPSIAAETIEALGGEKCGGGPWPLTALSPLPRRAPMSKLG